MATATRPALNISAGNKAPPHLHSASLAQIALRPRTLQMLAVQVLKEMRERMQQDEWNADKLKVIIGVGDPALLLAACLASRLTSGKHDVIVLLSSTVKHEHALSQMASELAPGEVLVIGECYSSEFYRADKLIPVPYAEWIQKRVKLAFADKADCPFAHEDS